MAESNNEGSAEEKKEISADGRAADNKTLFLKEMPHSPRRSPLIMSRPDDGRSAKAAVNGKYVVWQRRAENQAGCLWRCWNHGKGGERGGVKKK